MFESYSKRKAVEGLEARKLAMISGLHANMNMTGEGLRKAVDNLENSFEEAVAQIYGRAEDKEIDKDNPFFGSMKLPEIE